MSPFLSVGGLTDVRSTRPRLLDWPGVRQFRINLGLDWWQRCLLHQLGTRWTSVCKILILNFDSSRREAIFEKGLAFGRESKIVMLHCKICCIQIFLWSPPYASAFSKFTSREKLFIIISHCSGLYLQDESTRYLVRKLFQKEHWSNCRALIICGSISIKYKNNMALFSQRIFNLTHSKAIVWKLQRCLEWEDSGMMENAPRSMDTFAKRSKVNTFIFQFTLIYFCQFYYGSIRQIYWTWSMYFIFLAIIWAHFSIYMYWT